MKLCVRMICLAVFGVLAISFPSLVLGQGPVSLPRSTAEAQGVSSQKLGEFLQAIDEQVDTMHSFMLVRHGHVIAEAWWSPETADQQHVLWSLSKSFTSTAVGLAIDEKLFSLDDPVVKFFPDEAPVHSDPANAANWKAMQVRDLLTMSTGHEIEPKLRGLKEWRKAFLSSTLAHKPGTFFKYNTSATYMQSAIVQKVTGQSVLDYLRPRLFDPLGIVDPQWDTSPEGVTVGGYGLYLKTEDIAKFGQLYLQKGNWSGKQLIPADWIEQATSRQVSNGSNPNSDWEQGYGFQFWQCRNGAYRGDGKDGQFCIVLPKLDAVVVMTAETNDLSRQLNLVWDKLLPAMEEKALSETSEAPAAQKELASIASKLKVKSANLNKLTAEEVAQGWQLLFDGSTTDGWRNYKRETVNAGWKVINGALVRSEKGAGDIITQNQYDAFELTIDFKISPKGNSGIMYHVAESDGPPWKTGPEIQIQDNQKGRDPQKCGWLYQLYPSSVDATKPAGQWNQLRILITPEKCLHIMNGIPYCEYVKGSDDWNQKVSASKFSAFKDFGKPTIGHICLQDHNDLVAYRNIKVRPIRTADKKLP